MMPMIDKVAAMLNLGRSPNVEEALGPWLGMTPSEADAYAGDPATQDGLDPERLHGLLLLMATRLPDPRHAALIAALVHHAAPAAPDADTIRRAMHLLSVWRRDMDDGTFARIRAAKAAYEDTWNALRMAGMEPDQEECLRLVAAMDDVNEIDHAVVDFGDADLVVEMTSDQWIVGLLLEGSLLIVDVVPYGGRGGGGREDEPAPDPAPRLLQDA